MLLLLLFLLLIIKKHAIQHKFFAKVELFFVSPNILLKKYVFKHFLLFFQQFGTKTSKNLAFYQQKPTHRNKMKKNTNPTS